MRHATTDDNVCLFSADLGCTPDVRDVYQRVKMWPFPVMILGLRVHEQIRATGNYACATVISFQQRKRIADCRRQMIFVKDLHLEFGSRLKPSSEWNLINGTFRAGMPERRAPPGRNDH
jgi:hypothetical protein